jgi:hypothetical protein
MNEILPKLCRRPVQMVARGFNKFVIARRRYGTGEGYVASRDWRDRFSRYDSSSLLAAGDAGLSEEESRAMYSETGAAVTQLCAAEGVDLKTRRVLMISELLRSNRVLGERTLARVNVHAEGRSR